MDKVAIVSRNADGTSAQATRFARVVDAAAATEADAAQRFATPPTDAFVRTTGPTGFYGKTPVDQPAAIVQPTTGLTKDAEARATINNILAALRALGLIAT